MAFGGAAQLVVGALFTLLMLLSVGSMSYAMISYGGGLTSTREEAVMTVIAGLTVLLFSGVQFISGLSAIYVAVSLARGWRRTGVFVACGLSVIGPIALASLSSLSVMASFTVGVALSGVFSLFAMGCMVAATLAAWASATGHPRAH